MAFLLEQFLLNRNYRLMIARLSGVWMKLILFVIFEIILTRNKFDDEVRCS